MFILSQRNSKENQDLRSPLPPSPLKWKLNKKPKISISATMHGQNDTDVERIICGKKYKYYNPLLSTVLRVILGKINQQAVAAQLGTRGWKEKNKAQKMRYESSRKELRTG